MDTHRFASTTIVLLIAVLSISLLLLADTHSPYPIQEHVVVPEDTITENTQVIQNTEFTSDASQTQDITIPDNEYPSEINPSYTRMQDSCITVPTAYWENAFEAAHPNYYEVYSTGVPCGLADGTVLVSLAYHTISFDTGSLVRTGYNQVFLLFSDTGALLAESAHLGLKGMGDYPSAPHIDFLRNGKAYFVHYAGDGGVRIQEHYALTITPGRLFVNRELVLSTEGGGSGGLGHIAHMSNDAVHYIAWIQNSDDGHSYLHLSIPTFGHNTFQESFDALKANCSTELCIYSSLPQLDYYDLGPTPELNIPVTGYASYAFTFDTSSPESIFLKVIDERSPDKTLVHALELSLSQTKVLSR